MSTQRSCIWKMTNKTASILSLCHKALSHIVISLDFVILGICHLGTDHLPPVCHQMSCSQLLLSPPARPESDSLPIAPSDGSKTCRMTMTMRNIVNLVFLPLFRPWKKHSRPQQSRWKKGRRESLLMVCPMKNAWLCGIFPSHPPFWETLVPKNCGNFIKHLVCFCVILK